MKIIVVGCGLSGIISAVILKSLGHDVDIFEERLHIGGNCYDNKEKGVLVHQYGPHAFHTDKKYVWDFLCQYTKFNNFSLRVVANTSEGQIPIPFNLRSQDIVGMKDVEQIKKLLFIDYSEKMWGCVWKDVPKAIWSRVPSIRENYDDRYHTDEFQGVPCGGYTEMFRAMLDGIKVHLGVAKHDWKKVKKDLVIYTGKIDDYYDNIYGELPYRSLKFVKYEDNKRKHVQVNECNKNPWTREVDHSHFLNQNIKQTIITREYPCEHDKTNLPFYPIPSARNIEKYQQYKRLNKYNSKLVFLGRLATYKYLDMDNAIAQVFKYLKY